MLRLFRLARRFAPLAVGSGLAAALPATALAQASPFLTGATALQSNILAWLTPIAVILVMALGAIVGIAIAFGAPQIVTWVRGMFGV